MRHDLGPRRRNVTLLHPQLVHADDDSCEEQTEQILRTSTIYIDRNPFVCDQTTVRLGEGAAVRTPHSGRQ